ncbi:MAG: hypothetical protein JST29_05510 [Bacteroidetes bacterium]|nr:hypothetical protein [Bacteroidota bacterium]
MENNGLLSNLLNNTNVNFTVSIDDKSIIHLAIALLIVVCIGLLLWGIARKYS